MRVIIGLVALLITSIKLSLGLLIALYKQQPISVFTRVVAGKGKKPLKLRVFMACNTPLCNVDIWIHYLRGDFNLIGPAGLGFADLAKLTTQEQARFKVAPGIITPFKIALRRADTSKQNSERSVSMSFANHDSLVSRLKLLLSACSVADRSLPTDHLRIPDTVSLFGVDIQNTTMQRAVDWVLQGLSSRTHRSEPVKIAFINADCVNQYVENLHYQRALKSFEHLFADGVGLRLAARRHGARMIDNVNGTDMFPILCRALSDAGKNVFLYGAKTEVVEATARRLKAEFPGLNVVGYLDGFTPMSAKTVCHHINLSKADIVFVALGAPKQELWIMDNAHRLEVGVAMGVGGLFDFYSGAVSRAPAWVRAAALEWVWRLAMQPFDKAKRYLLGNPLFLYRVLLSRHQRHAEAKRLEVC